MTEQEIHDNEIMAKQDRIEVVSALSQFVKRVSKGEATTETEVIALPAVARVLNEMYEKCYG